MAGTSGWTGRWRSSCYTPGWPPTPRTADAENRRRFETEARSAAALNHPNIVAVHDSGEHHGTPFIVMERLPGGTLADLIAHGPLPQQLVYGTLPMIATQCHGPTGTPVREIAELLGAGRSTVHRALATAAT